MWKFLIGEEALAPYRFDRKAFFDSKRQYEVDFDEVKGQHHTPPQFLPAAVWQGRSSGEAFADLLRERAGNRNWRITVEVQQWEQSGGYGVSAEWGEGPDQEIMYEVVDWVGGCRLLDHHGEDLTVEQGLAYFEARAAGMGHRQALVHADPSRASLLSRWRVRRRGR